MIPELLEVEREWDRIYDEFEKKRSAAIKKVLPVGTRVSWKHGPGTIHGTVVKLPDWGGEYIDVKNTSSGNVRQIKASYLSLDPADRRSANG